MKFNRKALNLLLVVIAFLVLPQKNWSDWLAEPGDRYGEHHLTAGERLIIVAKNAGSDTVTHPDAVPVGARTLSGKDVPQWLLERGVPGSSYAVLEVPVATNRQRWMGAEPFETGELVLATPSEVRVSMIALVIAALAFGFFGLATADYLGQRLAILEDIEREHKRQ